MKGLRRITFVVIFVGLLYVGWRFADGNAGAVDVDYVFGRSGEVALWKALLLAGGVGVAVTFCLMIFSLIGARLEARRFRKAVVGLESELAKLRPSTAIVEVGSGHEEGSMEGSDVEVVGSR